MRTIEQMVQSEVLCCMSSMVATLANAYGSETNNPDANALIEQAMDLSASVPAYEEAAASEGWVYRALENRGLDAAWSHKDSGPEGGVIYESAEACCNSEEIEWSDFNRQVYEHWAVSSWLTAKLEAAGEKVDTDFAGLCIWARTTTGQAIYTDHVIEQIFAATHYDEPELITVYRPEGCKRWRVGYGPTIDIATAETRAGALGIATRWQSLATGPKADAIRAA